MAEALKISFDRAKLSADLRRFQARHPRAVAISLSRTAKRAETLAVREIQADAGASAQKTIRRNLKVRDASENKLEAAVVAYSSKKDRIPLFELRPRPRAASSRRPATGVSYGNNRRTVPGSFIATVPKKSKFPGDIVGVHTGVFRRIGNRIRLTHGRSKGQMGQRIVELFGPSVALVFARKKIQSKLRELAARVYPDELARAFKFAS